MLNQRPRTSARSRARIVFYRGERRQVERFARRLFGRDLHPWEYAGLAGAPDEALVEVGTLWGDLYLELCEPLGHGYRGIHLVRPEPAGAVLVNDGFHIQRKCLQRKGLGLRVLQRQLDHAKALGIVRIEVFAGRVHGENGYYTWPRYGFNGPVPPEVRRRLPDGLRHARSVLDLVECEQGRRWWREHGVPLHVSFDLSDQSRSWAALRRYLLETRQSSQSYGLAGANEP